MLEGEDVIFKKLFIDKKKAGLKFSDQPFLTLTLSFKV